MDRWLIFLKERLPIPVLLLLSIGASLSSLSLDAQSIQWHECLLAILQPGLFLLTLRLMDEVKDFEKDKIVHPERPLPRGLLSVTEVTRAIYLGLGSMALIVFILATFGLTVAAAFYACSTCYLWLMYKEFFIGSQLEKSPFLYAVTHQIIMLPLAASMRAIHLQNFSSTVLLQPGLMFLGVFFTFEICRKLDPTAPRSLGTYRIHYGEKLTFLMILATSCLTFAGMWILFADSLINTVCLGLVAFSVPLAYLTLLHKNYKILEGLASLSLLLHIWWPFARHIIGG